MRILILANIGLGLYKFRKELLEELVKNNDVFFSIPNDEFVEKIEKIGCTFIDNKYLSRHGTNPIQDFHLLLHYISIIKDISPDIVFSYTIKPNVYGGIACSMLGTPYVANITGLGSAVENAGLLQKLTLFLYRIGLRNARKVFFQNRENMEFFRSHNLIKNEYELLPGSGVNLSYYRLLPYPIGDTVDFVFIARVMKEKGIDQYLEAARFIKSKHPETRFHICGFCEEDYEEKLKRLNDDGTVIYHGLVSDMIPIYEKSSCIIHPSYYPEGLSNVLLEGASCGRPIITTNRSGCREVVNDSINGYLIKPKDSQSLIEAIEKFLQLSFEEKKAMGIAGRKHVENNFDRSIVIDKYIELLE